MLFHELFMGQVSKMSGSVTSTTPPRDQVKKLPRAEPSALPAASATPGEFEKKHACDIAESGSRGDRRGHVFRTRAPMSETLPPTAGNGCRLARE